MRLRLQVLRHQLPPTRLLWKAQSQSQTVAELLGELNDFVPLEAEGWGLEDYAVQVGDFECLHYQTLNDILKDEDQVTIRPLETNDVRARYLTGRHQISSDGRHLVDGIAFGRPKLRRPVRPRVHIPARRDAIPQHEEPGMIGQASQTIGDVYNPRNKRRRISDEMAGLVEQFEEEQRLLRANGEEEDEEEEEDEDFIASDEEGITDNSSSASEASWDGINSGALVPKPSDQDASANDSSSSDVSSDDTSSVSSSSEDSSSDDSLSEESSSDESSVDERPARKTATKRAKASSETLKRKLESQQQSTEQPAAKRTKVMTLQSSSMAQVSKPVTAQPVVPPGTGMAVTRRRNVRRKDAKKLRWLKSQGIVAQDADRQALHQWRETQDQGEQESHEEEDVYDEDENYQQETDLWAKETGNETSESDSSDSDSSESPPSEEGIRDATRQHAITAGKSNHSKTSVIGMLSAEASTDDELMLLTKIVATGRADQGQLKRFQKHFAKVFAEVHSGDATDKPFQPTDPVVQMLTAKACLDPELKSLMMAVSSGHAKREQKKAFQKHIDELKKAIQSARADTAEAESASAFMDTGLAESTSASKSRAFDEKRQALLDAIAQGGIDVTPKHNATPVNGASTPDDGSADRTSESTSKARRAKLDLAGSQRLLFGSLGVRAPKTDADREKLRVKLAAQGQRKPVNTPVAKPAIEETTVAAPADETEVDPDAWRYKINLTAVECCDEDVELSTPPFPFYQRWDPSQWQNKKRKRNSGQYNEHKKNKRRESASYYFEGEDDGLDYDEEGEDYDEENAVAEQLLNETAAATQEDDLPPLPADISQLPMISDANIDKGDIIVFSKLEVSAETNWQPQQSPIRTAIVLAVDDEGVDLRLAKRDLPTKEFDDDGNRVYSKFEMHVDDEDEEGVLSVAFVELLDPRLLAKASEANDVEPVNGSEEVNGEKSEKDASHDTASDTAVANGADDASSDLVLGEIVEHE